MQYRSWHSIAAISRWPRRRVVVSCAAVALVIAVAATEGASGARVPRVLVAGVAQDPCHPLLALAVKPGMAGHFEPGTSLLVSAGGIYVAPGKVAPLTAAESACATGAARADSSWLAAGAVPGATAAERSLASRALLDLRLAVQPDGAVVAGWHHGWKYAWPRDSSWVAAALAGTGHTAIAFSVLRFLQHSQQADGTWATRYQLDGAGPVPGRAAELDAVGWVPWAVWCWYTATGKADPSQARAGLRQLWPMVARAADAAAVSLASDGLPRPAMDYWEDSTKLATIETAAALQAGLRSAADLAGPEGSAVSGRRWSAAARRLSAAISHSFGMTGYQRTPAVNSGPDAAVTLLGPPFAPAGRPVEAAVASAARALRVPNGGMKPGTSWGGLADIAWTPETAFFALSDAASGSESAAGRILTWLSAHRTSLGEIPEQVNQDGQPDSVAPLSWTDAIVLLTLLAQQHQLPALPVPPN